MTESEGTVEKGEPSPNIEEDTSIQPPQLPGNYMARKQTRWVSTLESPLTSRSPTPLLESRSSENLETSTKLAAKSKLKKLKTRIEDVDAVHDEIDQTFISPLQLYSTESGRMFHAGKLCIALCGLPARGKTHLSVSLCRYLRWLGVRAKIFHLGDYRRRADNVSNDFWNPQTDNGQRQQIVDQCISDIKLFFDDDKGQVVIYDAINALSKHRYDLKDQFNGSDVRVLFIESIITDPDLLFKNVSDASKSPDYAGWDPLKLTQNYISRIDTVAPIYQEMNNEESPDLSFIKFINFGERLVLNNNRYGFLVNKIVFFLMNSRIKTGSVYFARCSNNKLKFKSDPPLDSKGKDYFLKLNKTLLDHIAKVKGEKFYKKTPDVIHNTTEKQPPNGFDGQHDNSFVVWTSTRLRTIQLSTSFRDLGITVRQRTQLTQKNPGDIEGLTKEEVKKLYPDDYKQHCKDPYHHRYSRAESYHDIAVKIEPLILEMERMSGDILIIADETVIKVFYGYLMSSSCNDIPNLNFPQNEIVEIKYNAYANVANRITIPGVEP